MSQLNVTSLKHEGAGLNNLVLDSSGNTTFGGAATVGNIVLPSGGSLAVKDSSNVDTYIGVDSAGRVTMPYQPAFHCSYVGGSSTVNYTVVIFPEANVNRGSHYNTSTGKFTAPVDGVYYFWCGLMVSSSGNTPDFRWHKNGATTGIAGYVAATFGGGSWLKAHGSICIYLNSSDTIEIRSVSNLVMHVDGGNDKHNQLGGFLIG